MKAKNPRCLYIVSLMVFFAAAMVDLAPADDENSQPAVYLEYDVFYRDKLVGAQKVTIARADGTARITALTGLDIRVLFVRYKFDEDFKAEFKDGRLHGSVCRTMDDGKPLNVTVTAADGKLRLSSEDKAGRRESSVDFADFDLYSTSMFLEADKILQMTAAGPVSVRVLQLDEGLINQQKIEQAGTVRHGFDGREYQARTINWQRGRYVNQSRHAAELDNLPLHYIYEDENGRTVFVLKNMRR